MNGSQTTPDILCKLGTAEASPLSCYLSHPGGESILLVTAGAGVSRAWDACCSKCEMPQHAAFVSP